MKNLEQEAVKMKTLIKITNDYNSGIAEDSYRENINYIVNEIDVFCVLKNNDYQNIVNEERRYVTHKEGYKNSIQIEAKGYSQGDWQTYILYYNEKELKTPEHRMYFSDLVKQLERTFTHKNNYNVEKFEQTEINGKEFNADPHDYTSFCVNHIEFPENDDIIKEYNEIYGKDYDKYLIEANN